MKRGKGKSMKKSKKLYIKKEIEQEAEQIEKEISENPDLESVTVTEEMDQRMAFKIQQFEREKAAAKTSASAKKPKKTFSRTFKRNIAAAVVLVVVLTAGLSMTSVGSKSYLKKMIEKVTGNATVEVTNVDDMDSRGSESGNEASAYQEISKMMGRTVVQISYRPSELEFVNYETEADIQQAKVFYTYNGEVLQYMIYLNDQDSSLGKTEEDTKINEETMMAGDIAVKVEEYQIEGSNNRFEAEFTYQGIQYQIKAVMERDEFEKTVENLYFPQ